MTRFIAIFLTGALLAPTPGAASAVARVRLVPVGAQSSAAAAGGALRLGTMPVLNTAVTTTPAATASQITAQATAIQTRGGTPLVTPAAPNGTSSPVGAARTQRFVEALSEKNTTRSLVEAPSGKNNTRPRATAAQPNRKAARKTLRAGLAAGVESVGRAGSLSEASAALHRLYSRGKTGSVLSADPGTEGEASGSAAPGEGKLKPVEAKDGPARPEADVPAPPSGGEKETGASGAGRFWTPAIFALIVGLGIAQVAQEFFGQAMPQLIKQEFGAFSVYASVMFFSLIGRTLGNAAGGILPDKFGLKRTFLGAEIGRAMTLGVLVGLLITGNASLPVYFGLSALNGVFTGITLTAEHSIPRVILGSNQRLLEKFYGYYQWILEFAGIGAPLLAGYIITQTGTFAWTLGAYPLILGAAILFFALMLRHPKLAPPAKGGEAIEKPARAPAAWGKRYGVILKIGLGAAVLSALAAAGIAPFLGAVTAYLTGAISLMMLTIAGLRGRSVARAKKGRAGGFLDAVDAALGQVLDKFVQGAGIALKTPALRTAVLAEAGFIALNGFLYALIAPAYGLYILGEATQAASVQAWMVGMYSLGSMAGALLMLRFNAAVEKKVEAGELSKAEEDAWMRRSTLRWMLVGALSIAAFLPLALPLTAPGSFLSIGSLLTWAFPAEALPHFLFWEISGLWLGILPIYGAMLLFGVLSVVPTIKLKSLAARLTPSDDVPKVMGFIQLMSSILMASSIFAMSSVLDAFLNPAGMPTQTAFWVLNGVLMAVMAALLAGRLALKRQLAKVPLQEEEKKAD